jgi:RNA polymerase sigma-70 factor, ECF subfamily
MTHTLPADQEITVLLNDARRGDRAAEERVFMLVGRELRRMAAAYLWHERGEHTLQPTALVNEAYIKLAGRRLSWRNRAQFFGTAARAMRRILVDHARTKHAAKRGGPQAIVEPLTSAFAATPEQAWQVLAIDQALTRLARRDARQARIVECRFFGGLEVDEVAEILGISATTVKREWQTARAWLYGELTRDRV